jgi:spore coat polysaccharide biosynthesis protein SpsF
MIAAIIQCREKSTRLKNKWSLEIIGKKTIDLVHERMLHTKADIIVIAIPEEDKNLLKHCQEKGYYVFKGNENDVLDRYYQCNKEIKADHVIRITADCPMIDCSIVDKLIDKHLEEDNDVTTNCYLGRETYPDGLDCTIFKSKMLDYAYIRASGKDREHVTSYMMNDIIFQIGEMKNNVNLSHERWTLDYEDDYIFVKNVYEKLYSKNKFFDMYDVLALLEQNPELRINKHERNEAYYA